ncbi:MAG: dockerin type I repeat-containing protein [candidate division Zixibacteria bacterium]|nr:dockerin type I repeat-containing protein [candidate division Zixibacteria bacterium]
MSKRVLVLAICFLLFTGLSVFGAKKPAVEKTTPALEMRQDLQYPPAENIVSQYLLTPAPKLFYPFTGDTVGETQWDFWHNDYQRRQIAVDSLGNLHFVWRWRIWDDIAESWGTPYLYYNYRDNDGSWLAAGTGMDVSGGLYGAYNCIDLLPDLREVIAAHHLPGVAWQNWAIYLAIEKTTLGLGEYSRYDIPDSIPGFSGEGLWAYLGISKQKNGDTTYMHVTFQHPTDSGGAGYVRCFIDPADDTLLRCQSPGRTLVTVPPGIRMPRKPVYVFAPIRKSTTGTSAVTSPGSQKVALAWIGQKSILSGDWFKGEVYYLESTNNGNDWMTAGNMGTPVKITNYGADNWDTYYTPQTDLAAGYDYNGNLHIVWMTGYRANILWHWDRNSGITTQVDEKTVRSTDKVAAWNKPINKMTLAFTKAAPNYVYVCYSKQDSLDAAATGFLNGEVIVKASSNSGRSWGPDVNLTNSHTPGCTPGNCNSDVYPSIAERADDSIYVFYLNDKDAGSSVRTDPQEGTYTWNPARYISIPRPLVPAVANIVFKPTQFTSPIKWATNHSSTTDSIKFDNTGTATLQVQLSGPSWLTAAPSSFSIVELGPTQKVTLTLNGGPYADTFLTGKLKILSNNGVVGGGANFNDTQYVNINFVVTDTFYFTEYDTCKRGPVLVVSNVSNMGGQSDSAGMFYNGKNYLFEGSAVMVTNQVPGTTDTVGFSWIHDRKDFIAEGHLSKVVYNNMDTTPVYIDKFAPLNWRRPSTNPAHWAWFGWTKWSKIIQFRFYGVSGVIVKNWWIWNKPPKWWMDVTSTAPVGGYFGIAGDWDVTAEFSGKDKGGIIDSLNLVYVRQDTVNADKYYGGYQFLGAYVKKGATTNYTTPFAMHVGNNKTQMYPTGGFDDDSLWKYMSTPGNSIEQDSAQDMNIIISAVEMLNPDTTTEIGIDYALVVTDTNLVNLAKLGSRIKNLIYKGKGGDANYDTKTTVSDVVYLVNYLFKGGPLPPLKDMGDANHDTKVTVSDVVFLVNYLFKGGPPPWNPFEQLFAKPF